jgi:uncharacterized membrane protein YfcA
MHVFNRWRHELRPVGARLAHTLNTVNLRRVFAVFMAVTAVRMFYALPG